MRSILLRIFLPVSLSALLSAALGSSSYAATATVNLSAAVSPDQWTVEGGGTALAAVNKGVTSPTAPGLSTYIWLPEGPTIYETFKVQSGTPQVASASSIAIYMYTRGQPYTVSITKGGTWMTAFAESPSADAPRWDAATFTGTFTQDDLNALQVEFYGNGSGMAAGNGSLIYGAYAVVTYTPGSVPSAPTGFSGASLSGQVALSWSTVADATSYAIYRSTSAGGEGASVYASASSTSYVDAVVNSGTTYYYKIAAVNSSGTSAQSAEVSVTPIALPSVPAGLSVAVSAGQLTLTWTASTGSTSYHVYRGTSSGGEGTTVFGTSSGTSFVDSSVVNGTTYFYTVSAVNAGGSSLLSSEVSGTPIAAPVAPSGLSLTGSSGKIVLSWSSVSGATAYYVYRSTASGSEGSTALATVSSTLYTDSQVANSHDYFYTVAALNAGGVSSQSKEVFGSPGPAQAGLFDGIWAVVWGFMSQIFSTPVGQIILCSILTGCLWLIWRLLRVALVWGRSIS